MIIKETRRATLAAAVVFLAALLALPARAASPLPSGCYNGRTVNSSGGEHDTTIQAAINVLPVNMSSHTCVVIMNAATYNESVVIQNFTNNGSSITIMSAGGGKPKVDPAGGQGAFEIKNASVNIISIDIDQGGGPGVPFAIVASSGYVKITSVTINALVNTSDAALSISSFTTVSYTTITVGSTARGIKIDNAINSSVSWSSVTSAVAALFIAGGASNTVSQSFFDSPSMTVQIQQNSGYNTISQTTVTSSGSGNSAINLSDISSYNVVTNVYARANGAAAWGVSFTNCASNIVSQSTLTGGGGVLFNYYSTANVVTQSFLSGITDHIVHFSSAASNTLSLSTITTNNASKAAVFYEGAGSSSNTLSQSYVANGSGNAVVLSTGVLNNKIMQSTITSNSSFNALYMIGASSNTVSSNTIANGAGVAILIDLQSNYNTLSSGTIDSNAGGYPALLIRTSSSNTLTKNLIRNPSGTAVRFDGASYSIISQSTMTGGSGGIAAHFTGASSNTITQSVVTMPPGGLKSLFWDVSSDSNLLSYSSVSIAGGAGVAMEIASSSSNTIQGSVFLSQGRAFVLGGGGFSMISQAVFAGGGASESVLFKLNTTSNTLTQASVSNSAGAGLGIVSGARGNTISLTTVNVTGLGVGLSGGSSNTLTGLTVSAGSSAALQLASQSDHNLVIFSTFTAGTPNEASVLVNGSSSNTISRCYLQASTGVVVMGSTSTVVNFSTIAVTGAAGRGIWARNGNINLALAKSAIFMGPAQGEGIRIDSGSGGLVTITSNTLQGGPTTVAVGAHSPLSQVWIATNTILPGLTASANSFGIKFDGLVTGATVFNNTIALRLPGSQGSFIAFAVQALNSSGLKISNNRLSNPRMISAGSWRGINLTGTTNSEILFNDIHSSGSVTGFRMILLETGSTGVKIRNNVLASSMTATFAGAFVEVTADSQSGFSGDFNDFFTHNGQNNNGIWGATAYSMLAAWRSASGQDANSKAADPYWAAPGAGVEDFHPMSQEGRFNPLTLAYMTGDPVTSQTIDSADSAFAVGPEPAPAGSRVNQGSYGNTDEASKTTTLLQILLPGEIAVPDSITGKTGSVTISSGIAFSVTVKAANQNWIQDSGIAGNVTLTTFTAIQSSFDQVSAMAGGAVTFTGLMFSSGASQMSLIAKQSLGSVFRGTSTVFTVYGLTSASPTATVAIPLGTTLSTLQGVISGTASDGTAVARVKVAIQKKNAGSDTGNFYDWAVVDSPPGTAFSAGAPVYATATLSVPNGTPISWSKVFNDSSLVDYTSYYVRVIAENPSNNQGVVETTFTFNANLLSAGRGDGQGSAYLATSTVFGCQLITSTIVFTAGADGVQPGGMVALHLPTGWSRPAFSENDPGGQPLDAMPANLAGIVRVILPPGGGTIELNPPKKGNTILGENWIVFNPAGPMNSGQQLYFAYQGFPPSGPPGSALQVFGVATQGSGLGNLLAITTSPAAQFLAGPPEAIVFSPSDPVTLGPLQTSPTMQIMATDRCGVSTVVASAVNVDLFAGHLGAPTTVQLDTKATFYALGGGLLSPPNRVVIPALGSLSDKFLFNTSTAGVSFEFINATATISGNIVAGARFIKILSSAAAFSDVSVDTGTLMSGVLAATMTAKAFANPAVINFKLSDVSLRWELIISSDPVNFAPAVVRRYGVGNPHRSETWNGINETIVPNQFVPPGTYYVKIVLEGGVASNSQLRVIVPALGTVYGTVNSTGASAVIEAKGPAAHYGNFAVASSTGYFQIFGLEHGKLYNITASSQVFLAGQPLKMTVSSNNVTASSGGVNLGAFPFPTPATLRFAAQAPLSPPREILGRIFLHNADYSKTAYGTLHYTTGSVSSDDGAQAFGSAASTWSVLLADADVYDIEVNIPELRISTVVKSVALTAGQTTEKSIILEKKANVYGYAVAPATRPFGTYIGVQGIKTGEKLPTAFGGAFIAPPSGGVFPTSAVYTLYGLDAGSWTLTARSQGFAPASRLLYISSSADVGNILTGGFELALGTGSVIVGTVTVVGDTSKLRSPDPALAGFDVFLNAFNSKTFTRTPLRVRLSTSSSVTSSTFSMSGLEDGTIALTAILPGFTQVSTVVAVTSGLGIVDLVMRGSDARLLLEIKYPSGALGTVDQVKRTSVFINGPDTPARLITNLSLGNTIQYVGDSAIIQLGPFGSGIHRIEAFFKDTGQFKAVDLPLIHGSTASVTLDLRGSTYTVKGSVSLVGTVNFSSANYSISVSSVQGLLTQSGATSYCLMGQELPVTTSAFHMELIPINPRNNQFLTKSFSAAPSTYTGCASISLTGLGDNPNPSLGYLAEISTYSAFEFKGVSPGLYILRGNSELDNNSRNGPELPDARRQIRVDSDMTVDPVKLDVGLTISGSVMVRPADIRRNFFVSLLDSKGSEVRSLLTSGISQSSFVFEKLAEGSYVLTAREARSMPEVSAKPVVLILNGVSQVGVEIVMEPAGSIAGKLAVQQLLPDGTTGPVLLIAQANAAVLPRNFKVEAVANPWFLGGLGRALTENCPSPDATGCPLRLDADGRFRVVGLAPGLYDVNFRARNRPEDASGGGMNLVSSFVTGVNVAPRRTTDVGVVTLMAAAELRGQVLDAVTSTPVANIPITARPSRRSAGTRDDPRTTTDGKGEFVLSGLDPRMRFYDVVAASRGEDEEPGRVLPAYEQAVFSSVDLSSKTSLIMRMKPAVHSISGRVTTNNGGQLSRPIGDSGQERPGALIFIRKNDVIPSDNPLSDIRATTDRQGNFNITSLATGSYRLVFSALDYGSVARGATILSTSVNIGTVTMSAGTSLRGALRKVDGSRPSQDDVRKIVAVNKDLSEILFATLEGEPNTRTVTEYTISGFKVGTSTSAVKYKLMVLDSRGRIRTPDEARSLIFTSTESASLDLVLREPPPAVSAKSKRSGSNFKVEFESTHPLRAKTSDDDRYEVLLSTTRAAGSLSQFELSFDRTRLAALYTPGVSETSYTLRLSAYSGVTDPDSLDPVNPQFKVLGYATFYLGVDGLDQSDMTNFSGGNALVEGDSGRVTLPSGAFDVDVASGVSVTLQISSENLGGVSPSSFKTLEEANTAALRFHPSAYPEHLLRAMAATPPSVKPLSAFYDVLLPLGIRTALSQPVPLTISYSSGTDPTTLNLYWYNAAANAYVLQQDITGAAPVIDYENRTITINVNHFSTFVLFQTGVNVITGDAFPGTGIDAFNFPNPFDLTIKTVNAIHPIAALTVRGTVIRLGFPSGESAQGTIKIFNVLGERVRTMDLGVLDGGKYYYQGWDGRNDSGHDVASGVYLVQVKIGDKSKIFKMALIK